jgi:DNA modification methylase
MPKRNPSTHQPYLFKRKIPQMLEGYYSSGPNPNLRRFVAQHGTPYDAETDDYNVMPFDKPISTKKTTAIYNMHGYHQGKKPHDAIRRYIKHYTNEDDIVLDPFCGSGGAPLAALLEGRSAIAIDLSPSATFITNNYCVPLPHEDMDFIANELENKVKSEIEWLYETRCDRCDGRAMTLSTVYSQVYRCPRCLEMIPLFDCPTVKSQTKKGKPKKIRVCPICIKSNHIEEIKTRSKARYGNIPVKVTYLCLDGCKPQQDERLHDDPNSKKQRYFFEFDLGKINEISSKDIPHWYPDADLEEFIPYRMLYKKDFRREDASRLVDLFTKRNLWALSAILEAANSFTKENHKRVALFAFTGVVLGMSRMNRHRPNVSYPTNILSGTYYLPPISQEEQPLRHVINKISRIEKGYKKILDENPSSTLIISTQSARDLSEIPSNSVDYIFTDPPYAANVQYGELNFVWEAWLRFNTDWYIEEIIINEEKGKTDKDWELLMGKALSECYRVLKPGRWLSLCYHDASEGTWQLVQDINAEIGFIPEQSETILFIDTDAKSYNQLLADKATRRDLVINFRKPRSGELIGQFTLFGDENRATFRQKAQAIITEALEKHPGSRADRLYDELVSRMVRKGEFERHNFDEILHNVAEDVDGRWYLLETADQVDEAQSAKEEAAADRLASFMLQYLEENPGEIGVHYSNLFEQYLPIQDKPRRLILEWLPEFFFKTEEGTWRPPASEEERSQKEALRTSGTLRRIKRFANGLLEGVLPHERDIPANIATAADWIRQCRRAGLYEQGRALYEKGGFTFDSLGEVARMEVEEDYQVCVRRS